jgi:hypothetical protein
VFLVRGRRDNLEVSLWLSSTSASFGIAGYIGMLAVSEGLAGILVHKIQNFVLGSLLEFLILSRASRLRLGRVPSVDLGVVLPGSSKSPKLHR